MSIASDAQDDALHNYYQNPKTLDQSGLGVVQSPVSGTAFQVSTKRRTTLYINVQTAAALTIALGPTAAAANVISASEVTGLGVVTLNVPAAWYVKLTGTMADLVVTAISE